MARYVVGLGEALWDMLPTGKQLGGAPANFAYHVSQLGLPGHAISAVGDDELGREIVNKLSQKELAFTLPTVNYPTGTVQVTLDAAGIPQYEIKEGVAWDNIPFTPQVEEIAADTRAVCFGSLAQRNAVSRSTILSFLDAMPQGEGIYRIFDINMRQHFYSREVIHESLLRCNILKINDEELEVIRPMFCPDEQTAEGACKHLMRLYELEILILTCGEHGSYVFSHEGMSFQKTPKVKVADTVGAGDSFTAAFTAELLKGTPIREVHYTAVQYSAYVCTQPGAMPRVRPEDYELPF